MNNPPKVTVVIPVYNGSDYLQESINCVLNQNYQNIELIVVNDGSNDEGRTEKIALTYGNKIRYFKKENGGVASALNYGINKMSGEWFIWLSHDDIFSLNRIESDINLILKKPEIRVIFSRLVIINENGSVIKKIYYPIDKITNLRDLMQLRGLNMCALTIHKSCFDITGPFDENNRTTQDIQMSLILAKNFIFHLNSNTLTYNRDHKNRGTYSAREQHRKDSLYLANFIYSNFSINDFFPSLNNNFELSKSWIWMGFLYHSFGAVEFSNECFKKAINLQTCFYNRIIIKILIKSKKSYIIIYNMVRKIKFLCLNLLKFD